MISRQLRALLWKDFRLNRLILILGVGAIMCVYLASFGRWVYEWRHLTTSFKYHKEVDIPLALVTCLGALALALVGSQASGSEYADRSAGFLAYQPPSRRLIVLSKAISALVPAAILTVIVVATFLLVLRLEPHSRVGTRTMMAVILTPLLTVGWLILAGAWGVAGLSRSVPIGTTAGLAIPMALFGLVMGYVDSYHQAEIFKVGAVVLGAVLAAVSTVVMLLRREP
jgi:ABC-type transport system involved in multi-copper enzyme maturation permease subunit